MGSDATITEVGEDECPLMRERACRVTVLLPTNLPGVAPVEFRLWLLRSKWGRSWPPQPGQTFPVHFLTTEARR